MWFSTPLLFSYMIISTLPIYGWNVYLNSDSLDFWFTTLLFVLSFYTILIISFSLLCLLPVDKLCVCLFFSFFFKDMINTVFSKVVKEPLMSTCKWKGNRWKRMMGYYGICLSKLVEHYLAQLEMWSSWRIMFFSFFT